MMKVLDWIIENVLFIPFVGGIIFMITAGIVNRFPPKKINHLYGYRTDRSMKSQQSWDFAQKYSSKKMFQAGTVLFVLSFTGIFLPGTDAVQLAIGLPIALSSCIFMFFTTERALKRQFPNS